MYTIKREDLVKMIKKESNLGFKRVLQNHLRVMDGLVPECITCVAEDNEIEQIDSEEEQIIEEDE